MRCFYHPETEAAAICKNCHKGLCPDCALDVGNGMACKDSPDHCPDAVRLGNKVLERSRRSYQNAAQTYGRYAIVTGLMGALFTLGGLSFFKGDTRLIGTVIAPIGLLMLLLSLYYWLARRSFSR